VLSRHATVGTACCVESERPPWGRTSDFRVAPPFGVVYYTEHVSQTALASRGRHMPAQLLPLNDGPSILLDKPILLIGRHPECDIQIDSRKVSRRHCCIAQVADYLVVRDLGSTNGLRINGVRVLEGKLHAGDELTIGNNRFQVRWDSLAPGVGPRPPAAQEQPPRPAPAMSPGDDALESCEDPVPLDEPPDSPRPLPRARKMGPPPQPLPDLSRPILPDELELAPASDIYPAGPAPSHHSHHSHHPE
jgi:predicted component of type VI protein secretion system